MSTRQCASLARTGMGSPAPGAAVFRPVDILGIQHGARQHSPRVSRPASRSRRGSSPLAGPDTDIWPRGDGVHGRGTGPGRRGTPPAAGPYDVVPAHAASINRWSIAQLTIDGDGWNITAKS